VTATAGPPGRIDPVLRERARARHRCGNARDDEEMAMLTLVGDVDI
jgi:hypothetical protein